MTGPGNVQVSVHVAASPEATLAYLTGPARYVQWMGSHANLEPVPGGTYRVQMADGFAAADTGPRSATACGASGRAHRGGTGDGPRNWQTVQPGSRTCGYSRPPANTYSSRGSTQTGTPWWRRMRWTWRN